MLHSQKQFRIRGNVLKKLEGRNHIFHNEKRVATAVVSRIYHMKLRQEELQKE